jgi:Low molecular weight phosphotyrosine protein phosphatase
MKLLFGKSRKESEVKRQEEKTVLFVCVENAGRSQMAEAFLVMLINFDTNNCL